MKEAEKEQQDTAKLQKEDEKKLAEAKKERDAAKMKLDAAKTEDEKRQALAEFEIAEEKVKQHELHIELRKAHIEKLKEKVKEKRAEAKRGIENTRLHEQTHLDITAFTAERANDLLKHEPDPTKRQAIIDAAYDIAEKTDDVQDGLLNPGTFGSPEDDTKLAGLDLGDKHQSAIARRSRKSSQRRGCRISTRGERPILASGTVPGWYEWHEHLRHISTIRRATQPHASSSGAGTAFPEAVRSLDPPKPPQEKRSR